MSTQFSSGFIQCKYHVNAHAHEPIVASRAYSNNLCDVTGEEVVFQCRDEGQTRARIQWVRGNNKPLPPGTQQDRNGRLEIPNIQLDHAGPYICEAIGYPSSVPGSRKTVNLEVEPGKLYNNSE